MASSSPAVVMNLRAFGLLTRPTQTEQADRLVRAVDVWRAVAHAHAAGACQDRILPGEGTPTAAPFRTPPRLSLPHPTIYIIKKEVAVYGEVGEVG